MSTSVAKMLPTVTYCVILPKIQKIRAFRSTADFLGKVRNQPGTGQRSSPTTPHVTQLPERDLQERLTVSSLFLFSVIVIVRLCTTGKQQ